MPTQTAAACARRSGHRPLAAALAALLSLALAGHAQAVPGDLYVSNFLGNTIERFTPGGAASVFASTGLSGPTGLAFDGGGNLYAANQSNDTIKRFTPGGAGSVFASAGLSSPFGLAFEPVTASVPEPAPAALLALGLGGLASLRRRRAR